MGLYQGLTILRIRNKTNLGVYRQVGTQTSVKQLQDTVKTVKTTDNIICEVKSLSCVRLFVTPRTVAYQDPLSMGFSRQGYWSGLPFPSPGDLPNPGIEPGSPALQQMLYCMSHQGSIIQPHYFKAQRRGKGGSSDIFSLLGL